MNQALGFGFLLAGGVMLTKALTGSSFGDVLQGHGGPVPTTGDKLLSSVANNGVGGVGTAIANAAAPTPSSGPRAVGEVTYAQLEGLAVQHGWDASQISDWIKVITQESGGNPTATNSKSGAYGIAQGITGASWYAQHGGNANTVEGQLTAMANYITQRYGSPSAAWAHEQANNWY